MRIHYLQHVAFEDPANIFSWASRNNHDCAGTRLHEGEALPSPNDFDMLVVMGGPMSVGDNDSCPWLVEEKRFIESVVTRGRAVLGVCLGAQLIADALGGGVVTNAHKEIGWHDVRLNGDGIDSPLIGALPQSFNAFHWHGDMFLPPPGCAITAESDACPNQAFEYDGRVIGLQFHLESTGDSIDRLLKNCGDELVPGAYIQSAEEMRAKEHDINELSKLLYTLLDRIENAM